MKTRLESGMETVLSFLMASFSAESLTSMMTGLADAMNAFVAATSRMFSAPTVAAEAPASSPKPLAPAERVISTEKRLCALRPM